MSQRDDEVVGLFREGREIPGMHRERLVLLTTTGRVSGERRTTPMMLQRVDGRVMVVASANASPTDPSWYRNLVADPHVHVELDGDEFDALARTLTGEERTAAWAAILQGAPFFADHQAQVDREIPVVALDRV